MTVGTLLAVVLLVLGTSRFSDAATDASLLSIEAFATLPHVSSIKISPSAGTLRFFETKTVGPYLTIQLASGQDAHVVVSPDNKTLSFGGMNRGILGGDHYSQVQDQIVGYLPGDARQRPDCFR